MKGPTTKVWQKDPHCAAKHDILKRYLQAWFPIMGRFSQRIHYLDGFAGPGTYENGEDGSPIIALDVAMSHIIEMKCEMRFSFIEGNIDRANHLREVLATRFPPDKMPAGWKYGVIDGDFAPAVDEVLTYVEQKQSSLIPSFAFIDPFGYSQVPMELLQRFLKQPRCEILVNFMAGFAQRFPDPIHAKAQTTCFGTTEWESVSAITGADERCAFLLDLYQRQLKAAGATFVRSFEMRGDDGRILYYLVYATKHPKGLEVMKDAMWSVDARGTYKFSDRTDAGQSNLATFLVGDDAHWVPPAAKLVYDRFRGMKATVAAVSLYVLTETPYKMRKSILRHAEEQGWIKDVTLRKKAKTFPNDDGVITFAS